MITTAAQERDAQRVAPHDDVADARELMRGLRGLLHTATRSLALACARGQQLDNALLDRHQVASYDLAWAAAELLACETALDAAPHCANDMDRALALLFTGDALVSLASRLEGVLLEIGAPTGELARLAGDPRWQRLRQLVSNPATLRHTLDLVEAAGGEVGTIALDETHVMARDSFRRFALEAVVPLAESIHRDDLTVPESLLEPLRAMGVFGLGIPERFGGMTPDDHDDTVLMLVVTEALSEGSLAAAGSLITRPEILSRALLAGGTEAQKQAWLPRLAAGEPLCAIAITEPDFGSDVAALGLRATRTEGGWLLNGAKTWCTFAGKAGVLMVVARTSPDRSAGHRGLSLLLAEKPSFDGHDFAHTQEKGGRLSGRAIPTIGYRGMHSFDLAFEDYFVPEDGLVGEEAGVGKGFYFTMAGMVGGRLQTAARACGVMRAALRAARTYVADRKVFGMPLSSYPLTTSKLARMASRLAVCRQLAYAVARRVDAGGDRMEASLVKLLACRSAEMVTREAMQLHGGMGYAEESPVSRYFVDARVLSIFEGAEETLALKVITRSLLEQSLSGADTAQ